MSNIDMSTRYGGVTVTDRRWKPADVANPVLPAEYALTQDIRTFDAWLVGNNATYWTPTRLAQESFWDKLFFLRTQVVGNNGGLA